MSKQVKDAEASEKRIVWKDRKHHLWFPISFTKYVVDSTRLYISSGFFNSREDECLLYRVMDLTLSRNLWQKIFGTGTIEMNTKDRSTPIIRLVNIKNPKEVKTLLSDRIEEERVRNRVVGRDMYGSSAHIDPMEVDPDYMDDMDTNHY